MSASIKMDNSAPLNKITELKSSEQIEDANRDKKPSITQVVSSGTVIAFLPTEEINGSFIGVFEINDIQYNGQVQYSSAKKSKNKKGTDRVREQLRKAKETKKPIERCKIIGFTKEGVYKIQLV